MDHFSWQALGPQAPTSPIALPQALWSVLYNRGIQTQAEVEQHFSCSFKSLRSPWLMHGMKEAVDILQHAQKKHICIYADFDLDGTPGLALLRDGLLGMGYEKIDFVQPLRLSQGYGVHTSIVEDLAARGVELLITLDLGITDVKALTRAKELGLQVIVTDHHLPKAELPPADAIINPNQKQCTSGLGYLCGAGVAFYLLLALRQRLQSKYDLKQLLDCVAIATITDCVPLVRENRIFVKHGLLQLQNTKRVGLGALMWALKLQGRALSGHDVAFKLAPKLNALSRMEEEGTRPIDLFLVQELKPAARLAQRAIEVHKKRVQVQTQAEQELNASPRQPVNFVWAYSQNFHQGVVGLLATRMAEQHRVPAFVGVQKGDVIVGSARAFTDEHVLRALEASAECLTRFGGHAQAAGFELKLSKAALFEQSLQSFFGPEVRPVPFEFFYDAQLEATDLDDQFMRCYDALGPFGMGFKVPVFYMAGVQVVGVRPLTGGHMKLSLQRQERRTSGVPTSGVPTSGVPSSGVGIGGAAVGGVVAGEVSRAPVWCLDAICFVPKQPQLEQRHQQLIERVRVGVHLDVLVEPQWNYFNGQKSMQLLVHQFRHSSRTV